MRIDRSNYETYFLLYADNELDAVMQTEVELFVSQNADLAAELEALQQATLAADTVLFNGKESLYREENGISLANYEEYFLLVTDNELSSQQQDEVEKFVLTHPDLQQEITLLRQTRLEPPHLPFAGKEALYRKERRTVPLVWLRLSAAAVIGGVIAGAWFFTDNKGTTIRTPIAVVPKPAKTVAIQKPAVVAAPVVTEEAVAAAQPKAQNATSRKDETAIVKTKRQAPEIIKAEQVKQPEQLVKNNPLSELQKDKEANNEDNDELQQSQPVAIVSDNVTQQKETNRKPAATFAVNKDQDINPVIVTDAVYRVVDNTEEDNSFYIGSAEINRNKLKGLFKKAASLFDKKSSRNENRKPVQIAGFQIGG